MTLIDWDYAGWAPPYFQMVALVQKLGEYPEGSTPETCLGFPKHQYREEIDALMFAGGTYAPL